MEQEKTDEAIKKFIDKHGEKAWLDYIGTGKKPSREKPYEPPKKSVKEWVEKNFGGQGA